ncbi:DUF3800 domain-containing protein [Blastomonas sp.]|uniref:DUF3800 domain-containing protein n=1 Tax=Blastomonas sp. TaxID=1909299 RepID=UPI0017F09882|nr:DUF3800 domain-containing protein [Blastomonas sp.]
MFAYIDETGNTGAKLLDEAQPFFMTAALLTRSDFDIRFANEIRELAQANNADEIHAAELGVGRLEGIANDLLKIIRKAGPAFAIARVEKRYVVATKVFDTLFDAFENKAVPWHAYNIPALRMPLVFKLAYILDDEAAVAFIDALMESNDERAWSKMAAVCRLILPRVVEIPDARSREIMTNALEWITVNPEALQFVHSDKVGRKSHLPNIIGFGNLLGAIEKQSAMWGRPVDVIRHDRQNEFAAAIKFWHQMYSNAREDVIDHPFGGKMVLRRVFGSKLEISEAKASAGIQIIDVILWLFARSQKADLPPNCQAILDYVYNRGFLDDFSVATAERGAIQLIREIESQPISAKMVRDGIELRAEIEQRRLAGMADYALRKGRERAD